MKILLVTDSYPPEIRSASHLMLELAKELHIRGHAITVITSWPKYNLDSAMAERNFSECELESGIQVIRIKTLPHHNVNYVLRAFAQITMPLQFLWKLFWLRIKADAILVYSPPLPLALVGSWFQWKGSRFVLNIQDLFPQNAIDLGILRNKYQIKFFRAIEHFVYRKSDIVTVHSIGNYKVILEQNPSLEGKLRVLHNWVDIDHHDSDEIGAVDFRKRWSLTQKYIAVFAGVIGPSQYLELILKIAERMQDNSELLFLIVGDGKERVTLERYAAELGICNVRFENFISREIYPDLLRICSVGLVCLSPLNKTPVVPGKILGYMASGLPLAAFLHEASDGHEIIKAAECGVVANSGDIDACVEAMKNLMQRREDFVVMGESGLQYVKEHFSKKRCVAQLEKMLTY